MKKTLLSTLMVAFAFVAFSQSNKEEVDLVQSVFGMEKKAMAAEFIKLEGAQKDAFWVAYDEYEGKRKDLGKSASTCSIGMRQVIIKDVMKLQGENDKLISTYYGKIKKASGVKAAAQFYQFENYILSKIRAEIMEGIPLIGEFDK